MQDSVNGVVWYILGVNFVLSLYLQDIATVAILMYVHSSQLFGSRSRILTISPVFPGQTSQHPPLIVFTAHKPVNTPPAFRLRLPLAPRKSLTGFTAATITGAATGGLLGLLAISVVAGLVSGVAEALGMLLPRLYVNVRDVDYL